MKMQDENLLLSICIPTYNRSEYLKKSITIIINSIPDEWLKRIELIICDNSEEDESKMLCERILTNWNASYKYFKNSQNLGMIENWNECIAKSKGEFIYILHDDDFLFKNNFTSVLQTIDENKTINVFKFSVNLVDDNGKKIKVERNKVSKILKSDIAVLNLLQSGSYVRFPSMVVSRSSYLNTAKFDASFGYIADYEMWYRLFSENDIFISNIIIASYRRSFSSYSGKMFSQEIINLIKKLFAKVKAKEFVKYQDNFIARFMIAGIVRNLSKMRFKEAKRLFVLINNNDINPFLKYRLTLMFLRIPLTLIK